MTRSSFSAALLGLSFLALTARGQQTIQYPYNPDVDNDEYIATSDLTGFLAQFGQDFQPAPVLIDSVDLLSVIQMMQAQITSLQSQVASLEASTVPGLGDYVSVDDSAHTVLVSGANLQVHNGQSASASNGLGNVILGFNGLQAEQDPQETRNGSHNLVVGYGHFYTGNDNLISGVTNRAYGDQGVVFGFNNRSWDVNTTVLGGGNNGAYGNATTVVGGFSNVTYGTSNVVLGGGGNVSNGNADVIVGGDNNVTNGDFALCMGGLQNTVNASWNSILGGQGNLIEGGTDNCLILGGKGNDIVNYTTHSAILGGQNNHVGNPVAGSSYSAIVGGVSNNIVRGGHTAIFGGENNSIGAVDQESDVRYSVISGGRYNELISGYANGIYGGEQNKHLIASEDGSINETARTTYGGLGNQNKAGFGTTILGGQSLHALIRDTYNPGVATVDVLIGSAQRTFIGSTSSQGGQVVQTAFGTGE